MIELVPLGGIETRLGDPRSATAQPGYTLLAVEDATDSAPDHGMGEIHEARFLSKQLDTRQVGVSHFRLKPGQRQPFGHHHGRAEEVHLILSGSGRVKLDDEILDLREGDALRVGPEVIRSFEAGPDGMEFVVTGQKIADDMEVSRGWWSD